MCRQCLVDAVNSCGCSGPVEESDNDLLVFSVLLCLCLSLINGSLRFIRRSLFAVIAGFFRSGSLLCVICLFRLCLILCRCLASSAACEHCSRHRHAQKSCQEFFLHLSLPVFFETNSIYSLHYCITAAAQLLLGKSFYLVKKRITPKLSICQITNDDSGVIRCVCTNTATCFCLI